ncbi:hypothetical protein VKT23_016574 [Stygiomarasmius scandens]|uniref:Uncharacterized protein n=1 Tax=Marasmiellus scandens TaxID=2682957 RepID=A0ABR1IUK8_9AGAR
MPVAGQSGSQSGATPSHPYQFSYQQLATDSYHPYHPSQQLSFQSRHTPPRLNHELASSYDGFFASLSTRPNFSISSSVYPKSPSPGVAKPSSPIPRTSTTHGLPQSLSSILNPISPLQTPHSPMHISYSPVHLSHSPMHLSASPKVYASHGLPQSLHSVSHSPTSPSITHSPMKVDGTRASSASYQISASHPSSVIGMLVSLSSPNFATRPPSIVSDISIIMQTTSGVGTEQLISPSLVGTGLVSPSLVSPSLVGTGLVSSSLVSSSLVSPSLVSTGLVSSSLVGISLVGISLVGPSLVGISLVGPSLVGTSLVSSSLVAPVLLASTSTNLSASVPAGLVTTDSSASVTSPAEAATIILPNPAVTHHYLNDPDWLVPAAGAKQPETANSSSLSSQQYLLELDDLAPRKAKPHINRLIYSPEQLNAIHKIYELGQNSVCEFDKHSQVEARDLLTRLELDGESKGSLDSRWTTAWSSSWKTQKDEKKRTLYMCRCGYDTKARQAHDQ